MRIWANLKHFEHHFDFIIHLSFTLAIKSFHLSFEDWSWTACAWIVGCRCLGFNCLGVLASWLLLRVRVSFGIIHGRLSMAPPFVCMMIEFFCAEWWSFWVGPYLVTSLFYRIGVWPIFPWDLITRVMYVCIYPLDDGCIRLDGVLGQIFVSPKRVFCHIVQG